MKKMDFASAFEAVKDETANISNTKEILNTEDTKKTEETKRPQGRPPKAEKLRTWRYNLCLDEDLKYYLDNIAWKNHTSVTQYLNDMIRKEKEEYFANGGSTEGWKE